MKEMQPLPPIEPGDICARNVVTGEGWVPLADAERIRADAHRSQRCLLCRIGRWFEARRATATPDEAWDSQYPDGGNLTGEDK